MAGHQLKIMVSSTSFDLPEHREHVIEAILRGGCAPVAMEHGSATPGGNAIVYSRKMVEQADVYIGVFAYRYGSIVDDAELNPQRWSVTEHEYRRAVELGKKILIYFIHADHPVKGSDVDTEPERVGKLQKLKDELAIKYVGAFFDSPDNLEFLVLDSLQKLDRDAQETRKHLIPAPPALYAVPPYTLTDEFIGRQAELDELDKWATSAKTVMVYEAIGGMGKSALTWEWTQKHAEKQIPGLAGCLWWSFYDTGSSMRGLLRHALAYVRGQDPEELRTIGDWEAAQALVSELQKAPYLLVLDGFERILAAYHQMEKAQIPDDRVEDLRQCIHPTDGDLIRHLVDCERSKILISTRLMPRALESMLGVTHFKLEGLEPKDAESLARGKGIKGTSRRILEFSGLFGYHPLVLRVVCGMVNDPPHRGDFDKWLDDPEAGGKLELASLDLKQRKTHILAFALAGLAPLQRQLLSRISVLSDNADYETIKVVSPYSSDAEFYSSLKNLEDRRLIQWEPTTNTYDLHPVVRASAYQLLEEQDREPTYDKLRNHFAALPPENLQQASELAHLKNNLEILRLLIGGGRVQQAANHYRGDLAESLGFLLGAYGTICGLLRDLLKHAGNEPEKALGTSHWSYVINGLALSLRELGETREAHALFAEKIRIDLSAGSWDDLGVGISNLSKSGCPAFRRRGSQLDLELSGAAENTDRVARATMDLALAESLVGNYAKARELMKKFRGYSTPPRTMYRPGYAEEIEAQTSFRDGARTRKLLQAALETKEIGSRFWVEILQAQWELAERSPALALSAAYRAIAILRRTGSTDSAAHGLRAAASAMLGKTSEAREALQEGSPNPSLSYHLYATEAYIVLGELERARESVRKAYKIAWADGPPYCWHWELQRCRELMKQLSEPEPQLPPFDPAKAEKLPYEDEIRAAIEKLKAEKAKRATRH